MRPDQVSARHTAAHVLQRVGGSIGTAVLTVILQGHLDERGAVGGARPPSVRRHQCG